MRNKPAAKYPMAKKIIKQQWYQSGTVCSCLPIIHVYTEGTPYPKHVESRDSVTATTLLELDCQEMA